MKYLEIIAIFDLIDKMTVVAFVAISAETSSIDTEYTLEKEFFELI